MVRSVHPTTQPGLEVCVVSFEKPVAPQSSRRVEALAENKALAEVCWKWGSWWDLVYLSHFFKGILIQTKETQNATWKKYVCHRKSTNFTFIQTLSHNSTFGWVWTVGTSAIQLREKPCCSAVRVPFGAQGAFGFLICNWQQVTTHWN